MKLTDFHYELPEPLIAQHPLPERSASRLLHLERDSGAYHDRLFRELPQLLRAGDLLVFNDTRVIPARLFAQKETGGRVEVLVERLLGERACLAQLRASKTPREGAALLMQDGSRLRVVARREGFFELQAETDRPAESLLALLERLGHMPLPPYIRRADEPADQRRYQTVYARRPGAVAAPTAGLHFDATVLAALAERGIATASVTLHVGAGTFQPVRAERIEDHRMHSEWLEVGEQVCEAVSTARRRGGRVIAVAPRRCAAWSARRPPVN